MSKQPLLEINGLKEHSENGFALHVSDFSVFPGRTYAITGANGAGKTTLLKTLALLTTPAEGTLTYDGQTLGTSDDIDAVRRQITMVMQDAYLFRTTVFENVAYGLRLRGAGSDEVTDRTKEALEAVGLASFGQRKAQRLSRGETQRVAIARALALEPRVLLLDEPTASVDVENAGIIEQIIQETVTSRGMAVAFSTHQMEQAYRLADEVVTLRNGVMLETGPTNLMDGVVEKREDSTYVRVASDVEIQVVTERPGPVHVRIPPEDIIISRTRIESSARNSFPGTITGAAVEDDHISLTLDIGIPLSVIITKQSFADMKLTLDDAVYATFKTSAVRVY